MSPDPKETGGHPRPRGKDLPRHDTGFDLETGVIDAGVMAVTDECSIRGEEGRKPRGALFPCPARICGGLQQFMPSGWQGQDPLTPFPSEPGKATKC